MTHFGSAHVRPRIFPLTLTLLAMIILMGCGRSGEDTTLQQEPSFPEPTEVVSDPLPVEDAVDTITTSLPECGQYWQAQHMYSMLASSYQYGTYQPFQPNYGGYSSGFLQDRGFRGIGNPTQAMGCANDLMAAAAFLQSQAQFYAPGSIQTWLGGMVGWAYGGVSQIGVGYAGGQWGGYDSSAWGGPSWTH